jgi:hypothetical protein
MQLPNLAVVDTFRLFYRVIVVHQVRHLAAQQTHSDPLQSILPCPTRQAFNKHGQMLGALPPLDGLPKFCFHNGGTCSIIATSIISYAEGLAASVHFEECNEYVACLCQVHAS